MATLIAALAMAQSASSDDALDVEAYMALSRDRLVLIEDRLRRESRSPSEAEITALWERYGTDAAEYLAFRARSPRAVDDYLAHHDELRTEVDAIAERINALIRQQDGNTAEDRSR